MKDKAIIFDWIGTLYEKNKGLFPETREVLATLHPNYKIGLISKRKNPEEGYREIEEMNLINYFDSIIIARRKTPIEFKKVMRELQSSPKNTIVIGDRTIREIRIGNQLGCKTYWIQKGKHASELPTRKTGQPNYTIHNLGEILTMPDFFSDDINRKV